MADSQGIAVVFLDQTGAKSIKAKVAPTVTVKTIIPTIITKMQLPANSPDGQPMSYCLDHKEGGRRLLENQTLLEAGVKENDHLIVFPEITAGNGSPKIRIMLPRDFFPWVLTSGSLEESEDLTKVFLHFPGCKGCKSTCNPKGRLMGKMLISWRNRGCHPPVDPRWLRRLREGRN